MRTVVRATAFAALISLLALRDALAVRYNTFVGQEEAIKTQWAQVENQLQRRNDLIPNLVETTKGFAQQERDVFGQIADSRAKLAGAQTPEQKIAAANEQSAALARLLVVVENYPQLRSSETFARLMDELVWHRKPAGGRTHALQRARPGLQHARRSFPSNVTAGIFGFKEYPLFQVPESAKVAPKVDFAASAHAVEQARGHVRAAVRERFARRCRFAACVARVCRFGASGRLPVTDFVGLTARAAYDVRSAA